ncbi:dimethylarginine dimethylaminohydrolase family protein [Thermocladium modestius]|nr:arginine deiminase family protein [Thermocladium modestius]
MQGLNGVSMYVKREWDSLGEVMIHRPGIEMFYGLLHPKSFLYERAFSMDEALYEHEVLEHALEREGVAVHRAKKVIVQRIKSSPEFREKVVERVKRLVEFRGDVDDDASEFINNLSAYDPEFLFNVLVLRPTLILKRRRRSRSYRVYVVNRMPLANMYFMRDQQLTVPNGIIQGRMALPQRRAETQVTELAFEALSMPLIYRISSPGVLEGGDYMPMGDFAVIGYGHRSNRSGIMQAMGLLGVKEVAVVRLPRHPLVPSRDSMLDMHLDTFFNVAGDGLAVGNVEMMRDASVVVYANEGDGFVALAKTNLLDYMKSKGFNIIPITFMEQLSYASNFLTISDRKIVTPNVEMNASKVINALMMKTEASPEYSKLFQVAKAEYGKLRTEGHIFPHKPELIEEGVDFVQIDVSELTGGYGGIHCMTSIVNRH